MISSPHEVDFTEVVNLIGTKRPELKERLIKTSVPAYPVKRLNYNIKRLDEVLGLKETEFVPLEETILAAVDSIVAVEKQWLAAGFTVNVPLQ